MAISRKRNGAGELEVLAILAAIGGLGYVLYKAIPSAIGAVKSTAASMSSAAAGLAPTQSLNVAYNAVIPGTGQTVSELLALGYTNDEINQMAADAIAMYGQPVFMQPTQLPVGSMYAPFSSIVGWVTGG